MSKIKELYEFRFMLLTLIKQDLLGKYKRSFLGLLWVLINPLIMLCVYVLMFQYIYKVEIENYPIYLFIGLMGWNLFSTTLSSTVGTMIRNAGIVKKIYFPKELLPLSILIGNIINYILSFPIIILGILLSGISITWHIWLVPVILIVQSIFTYGLSLLFAALNVYARDIEQIVNNITFVWMFATPIMYNFQMVPVKLQFFYKLNPMMYFIEAYRDLLYFNRCFNIEIMLVVFAFSVLFLIVAILIFNKLQSKFAEVL